MKKLTSSAWMIAAFVAGIVFVYSCKGSDGGGGGTADAQSTVTVQEPLKVLTADTDSNQFKVVEISFSLSGFGKFIDGPFVLKTVDKITTGNFSVHVVPLGSNCDWANRTYEILHLTSGDPVNVFFPVASNQTLCAADWAANGPITTVVTGYVPYQ